MDFLITSDTHFSEKPKDEYRLRLLPWLSKQQEIYKPEITLILGDLTDRKDNHPASLVNKIVNGLTKLRPPVYILRGNHDCVNPNEPFFQFLNEIEGLTFITDNQTLINTSSDLEFIAHQRTQIEFDKRIAQVHKGSTILCHQTFDGARAETGAVMSGLSASLIEKKLPWRVYSGDVHKPQTCGLVTYIGSPYHYRFGDNFQPRVLLVKENGMEVNLHFDCPKKWTLKVCEANEIIKNEDLKAGDHVRVEIELTREELVMWPAHKQMVIKACQDRQLEVFGVELKIPTAKRERVRLRNVKTNEDSFNEFCLAENVPSQIKQVGTQLLKDV